MPRPSSAMELKEWLTKEASALGFDTCRVASASLDNGERLSAWLSAGHHASMDWMAETAERRGAAQRMWPEARSAIMLGLNYGPQSDPLGTLALTDRATISVYARNRDYHEVIKGKLKQLAGKLAARTGAEVKVFVDTAPLMEKPLAEAAGLGWQGKHSVLVSRDFGGWLFLGVILTTLEITPDVPESDHCGSCRRCLDICPTAAFPAPYVLDSRRCISYLTIEHDGPIDRELRPLMGNRVFGCDDCLAVCPWNKFAEVGREAKLQARADLDSPPLVELLALDDAGFRALFAGSPVRRAGRNRFLRNVLIAAGNARLPADVAMLAGAVAPHLDDPDPMVRGAGVWAMSRLDAAACARLKRQRYAAEECASVREEWEAVL
ncbi:MAG: tRNA epoxyqueuosine(34) reductase QueG [Bosea sp. (in: a-proteobacteria)]